MVVLNVMQVFDVFVVLGTVISFLFAGAVIWVLCREFGVIRFIIGSVVLMTIFTAIVGIIFGMTSLSHPIVDEIVLLMHYGPGTVAANNLEMVERKPLRVSNGDVLSSAYEFLYLVAFILDIVLVVCIAKALRRFDLWLFSGRVTSPLVHLYAEIKEIFQEEPRKER